MKNFIKENFVSIVLVITLLTFFKGCSDSREISKIKNEIKEIKDSTYTKRELNKELKISSLEAEKRMLISKILEIGREIAKKKRKSTKRQFDENIPLSN